ncbi:hypothetical protein SAMN05216587_102341 [Selenomonas ruminantium]|nr:hypothetical protein SAMN05216587_102341 [Selenomonas ruminantium]
MARCDSVPVDQYDVEVYLNDFNEDDSGLNVKLIGEKGTYMVNFGLAAGFRRIKEPQHLDCGLYIVERKDSFTDTMQNWMGAMYGYSDKEKNYLLVGRNCSLRILCEWELKIKEAIA